MIVGHNKWERFDLIRLKISQSRKKCLKELTNTRIMINNTKYFITSFFHMIVRTNTAEHRRHT